MKAVVLEPVGVEVTGLAIGPTPDATVVELRRLLGDHGVVVVRGTRADDDDFVAFLRSFGAMAFTRGETPVEGHPDLNVVSNVGRVTPPRSSFHVDTSYVRQPPAYTALRAVEIPEVGGQTLFTNQYRAADTLDPDLRATLAEAVVTHVVTGLDLGDDDETSAEHPLLRRHPLTGRTALYLSTPARCASVSGMAPEEAGAVIHRLYEHSTRADNVHRHTWCDGDVVMWDNGVVLHRADHDGVVGDRVMHRGMVAGYGPSA